MEKENKIKKRREEKSSHKGVIIGIIVFILFIVLGIGTYILYDKGIIFPDEKAVEEKKLKDDTNDKKIDKKEQLKEVEVDSEIENLFNLVHYGTNSEIYTNKKMNVADMSEEYKFTLAHNIYGKDIVKNETLVDGIAKYVSEDSVKNAYETIFGKDTYHSQEEISGGCGNLYYDAIHARYISATPDGCGGTSVFWTKEKILSAKKSKDTLKIVSAVVHYSGATNSICKDFDCNQVIDTYYADDSDTYQYLEDYIGTHQDKLQEYTYTFHIEDSGYRYEGFERTKE